MQFPIIHNGAKPRLLSLSSFQDYARNTFIGACYFDDENGYQGGVLIWKVTPTGDVSNVAYIPSIAGKGDSCVIQQVGPDIQVYLSVHVGDPVTQLQALPPVRNVCVAWPHSVEPHGQEGAYLAGEQTPEVEVDYGQIRNIVQEVVHTEVQRAIENMKPKTRAALDEAFTGGTGSHPVYQQLLNTSYSGALNAIRDSGIEKPKDT